MLEIQSYLDKIADVVKQSRKNNLNLQFSEKCGELTPKNLNFGFSLSPDFRFLKT